MDINTNDYDKVKIIKNNIEIVIDRVDQDITLKDTNTGQLVLLSGEALEVVEKILSNIVFTD